MVRQFLETKQLAAFHQHVETWNENDVIVFLQTHNLDMWSNKFREHNINGKTLLSFTTANFLQLQLPAKIIRLIQKLLGTNEESTFMQEEFTPGVTFTDGHKLEIDLKIVSPLDLWQILRVHNACEPCKLTLQTFWTLHRQCTNCNSFFSSSVSNSNCLSFTNTNCVHFQNLSLHDTKQPLMERKEVEKWTVDDVGKGLVRQQFGRFAPSFRDKKINGKEFLKVNDRDLYQMGFNELQIRKLKIFVTEQDEKKSSIEPEKKIKKKRMNHKH